MVVPLQRLWALGQILGQTPLWVHLGPGVKGSWLGWAAWGPEIHTMSGLAWRPLGGPHVTGGDIATAQRGHGCPESLGHAHSGLL